VSNSSDHNDQGFRLAVGTVIDDRYEVIGYLGEGGVACVYKARHVHMNREVAIKLLNPESDQLRAKVFEERFLQEAKIAASLRHPNIVNILDFGFTDPFRQPFLVMEYLAGHDLHHEIHLRGPVPPTRLLPLMVDCLDGLARGHKKGIVHKDLKPSNIFLVHPGVEEEVLIVLDFGLARDDGLKDARKTRTGKITGTPQYMAPEYIQYQIVSTALDVYQMALILIEALTGKAAVDDDNAYNCMVAHCQGDLKIPDALMTGALGDVLRRALDVNPDDRYPDAGEFRDALARIDAREVSRNWASPDRVELAAAEPSAAISQNSQELSIAPGGRAPRSDPELALADLSIAVSLPPASSTHLPEPTARTFNDPSLEDSSLPPAVVIVLLIALIGGLGGTGLWAWSQFAGTAPAAVTADAGTDAAAPTPDAAVTPDDDGARLLDTGAWDEALAWYDKALVASPDDARLLAGRERARKAIALKPTFASLEKNVARKNWAAAMANVKALEGTDWAPIVSRKGLDRKARTGAVANLVSQGHEHLDKKRWDAARKVGEQALALDPGSVEAQSIVEAARERKP